MISSASLTIRSEVEQRSPSAGTRAYFQARTRNKLYDFVLRRFLAEKRNGLTKAVLARRIGRKPEAITRLLGAPGNWTIDTVCDLLLGISGEELLPDARSPLDGPIRNITAVDQATMARVRNHTDAPKTSSTIPIFSSVPVSVFYAHP